MAATSELSGREQPMDEELAYAGFGRRVLAFLIDTVVLVALVAPTVWLGTLSKTWCLAAYLLQILVVSPYEPVLHGLHAKTVGKMCVGIKLRTSSGGPITWRHAVWRSSVSLGLALAHIAVFVGGWVHLSSSVFAHESWTEVLRAQVMAMPPELSTIQSAAQVWLVAEFATMLLNTKRRALHDFIGGTIVVRGA